MCCHYQNNLQYLIHSCLLYKTMPIIVLHFRLYEHSQTIRTKAVFLLYKSYINGNYLQFSMADPQSLSRINATALVSTQGPWSVVITTCVFPPLKRCVDFGEITVGGCNWGWGFCLWLCIDSTIFLRRALFSLSIKISLSSKLILCPGQMS